MCYDLRFLTRKHFEYVKRFGEEDRDLSMLQARLDGASGQPVFHTNAFDHMDLPVITNQDPHKVNFFAWGLIPHWVKDSTQSILISNKTLNAKSESMFEKPSFREAASKRRCIVIADGFYEHHHRVGKTFPYHIMHKDDEPIALAGLWERWRDQSNDLVRYTVSIVTTVGNELLAGIHNNPKLEGPRMPLILSREHEEIWLDPNVESREQLARVMKPYPSEMLQAFPVRRLRGKEYIGNDPRITEAFHYPELNTLF